MKTLEGNVVANGAKIAIVGARFNEFIVSKLISGAKDRLNSAKKHTTRHIMISANS